MDFRHASSFQGLTHACVSGAFYIPISHVVHKILHFVAVAYVMEDWRLLPRRFSNLFSHLSVK